MLSRSASVELGASFGTINSWCVGFGRSKGCTLGRHGEGQDHLIASPSDPHVGIDSIPMAKRDRSATGHLRGLSALGGPPDFRRMLAMAIVASLRAPIPERQRLGVFRT
jgi:hypothetical protein